MFEEKSDNKDSEVNLNSPKDSQINKITKKKKKSKKKVRIKLYPPKKKKEIMKIIIIIFKNKTKKIKIMKWMKKVII